MLDETTRKLGENWRKSPQVFAEDLTQMMSWIETKIVEGSIQSGYRVRSDDALLVAGDTLRKTANAAESVVRHCPEYCFDHRAILTFERALWQQPDVLLQLMILRAEIGRFVNWVQLLPQESKSNGDEQTDNLGMPAAPQTANSELEVDGLTETGSKPSDLQSETDEKLKRGAPRFKNDPPFGGRVKPETKTLVLTFMAEWTQDLNKTDWCRKYAEKMKLNDDQGGKNCLKKLHDYLWFQR